MATKDRISDHWDEMGDLLEQFARILEKAGERAGISLDGRWSLLDIGDHLFYAEKKSLEYLESTEARSPKKRPDLLQRLKLLWLINFLRGRIKAKAPGGSDPRDWHAEDRHIRAPDLISDFRKVRSEFRAFLADKDEDYFATAMYRHPIIGHIDGEGMMKFLKEHFKRHLGQAERLMKELDQA